jgi:streptomycin 6-kinase
VIGACLERWALERTDPEARADAFSAGATRLVPVRRRDGTPAVLKLVADRPTFEHEVATLRWYAGCGAARLLEVDGDARAMLLERIEPGHRLARLVHEDRDDEATLAMAGVMGRLWRRQGDAGAPPPPLPSIEDDVRAIDRLRARHNGSTGPLDGVLVGAAEALAGDLAASASTAVVLHGDLHHTNVLRGDSPRWVAIDPKGRIGDPAAETAALLRNPLAQLLAEPRLPERLVRRVDLLSEVLQMPRDRILGWGVVLALVAACWQLEDDGGGWEGWAHMAQTLRSLQ